MTTWLNLAAVAVGGALGAVSRYGITLAASSVPGGSTLWGTTLSNLIGCAAIGALGELSLIEGTFPPRVVLAVRVGFLGSLTTFSTFAAESTVLAGTGRMPAAGIYVVANLVLGWTVLIGAAAVVKGWLT